jgi:hypothetical protein
VDCPVLRRVSEASATSALAFTVAPSVVEWVGYGDTLIPEPARHLSPIMELAVGVSTRIDPDTLGHRGRFCTRRGSLTRAQILYRSPTAIYAAAELFASRIGTRPRM